MLISRREVQVEWGDCDPAGIVFYPRYFAWFDASTANHFKVAGLPKPELIRRFSVVGFPMVATHAQFLIPSRHGDEVTIETEITAFGRTSIEVAHRLLRADSLAVEGYEKRVLVVRSEDGRGIRPVPVPNQIKELFATA